MANLIVEQRPEGRRVTITISICEACIILERTIFSDTLERRPKAMFCSQPSESPVKGVLFGEEEQGSGMDFTPAVGQAEKGARGMPWHQEPTKDVTSCDKLRGGANIR